MSTTEYIIVDVGRADVRARVAGGDRRDHQLRHADRQRAHRLGDERRSPPEPPSPSDAVEPALGVQAPHDLRGAARHRLDGGAAVAGGGERVDVGAGRRGDLLAA